MGVNTGTQVKPAQKMIGSLEPTGPSGNAWIKVARADIIREYWIIMVRVAASAPAAPAMTMGTVTVPRNMAMMCCNEIGSAFPMGGLLSKE